MSEEESKQKVVLITGCSSGIGLETAIECAKNGHTVFATVRNLSKCTELEKRIKLEQLDNIDIIQMDVSSYLSIDLALSIIVKKTQRIDVLFNNAGFMMIGSLEDLTINEIEKQITTDLLGPIYLTKNVIPHMKNGPSGLIINMSSVAGKIGFGLATTYCVSKFGIEGFTESLRRELVTRNINVCLIEAGFVNTKFFNKKIIAKLSNSSEYAKDTQELKNFFDNIIKTKSLLSPPSDIAKKVTEIMQENGKNCRYVVGDVASHMINVVHHSNDDCKKMDSEIEEIMRKYG